MFFFLMDKGIYRWLGEFDIVYKVNVFIVCVIIEDIYFFLFGIFLRRIFVIINLFVL